MSAPVRSNSVSAAVPVAATDDLEALLAEHVGQGVGERLLVLDHEHAGQRDFPSVCQATSDSLGRTELDLNGRR